MCSEFQTAESDNVAVREKPDFTTWTTFMSSLTRKITADRSAPSGFQLTSKGEEELYKLTLEYYKSVSPGLHEELEERGLRGFIEESGGMFMGLDVTFDAAVDAFL